MKQKLLKTIVLGLMFVGGVNMAWAQSTYTWSASNWENDNRGEVTVDGTSLKVTKVKNHLVGIKTTTSFKLPYRQTYMIVEGTGFVGNESNQNDPNVTINGGSTKVKAKGTTTTTKLVFDISGQLPTETDFFGNVAISQVNLIVKTTAGNDDKENEVSSDNPTITSIDFYQPDMIDNATTLKMKCGGSNWTTVTPSGTGNKKTAFLSSISNNTEFGIEFNGNQKINNTEAYFVIESSVDLSAQKKFRSMIFTEGTSGLVYETNTQSGISASYTKDSETRYLTILNPVYAVKSTGNSSGNALDVYLAHETMNITKTQVYLKTASTESATSATIYRLGYYNIRELQDLYPALKNYKFTIDAAFEAKAVSNTSLQRTVVINTTNVPSETMQLEIRSLGNFDVVNGSNKPEIDLRNATITSGSPALIDIPSQFTTDGIFFLLSAANYTYFPTLVNKAKIKDATYANYYDGNITPYSNKMGSTSTYYYAHNRKFVEGYSSCCLPFAIKTTELPSNLEAYTFASCTAEGAVTFAKADGAIAANTPMIIHASEAGYYLIPASATGTAAIATPESYYATEASNGVCFVGSFVNEVPTGDYASTKNYGVTSDGKKLAKMGTSTKTTYYRAFLASSNANFARDLSLGFDDGSGTTEIVSLKDVHGMEPVADGAIYNLQGVRMQGDNLPRGIYVKNGKKFVVK